MTKDTGVINSDCVSDVTALFSENLNQEKKWHAVKRCIHIIHILHGNSCSAVLFRMQILDCNK